MKGSSALHAWQTAAHQKPGPTTPAGAGAASALPGATIRGRSFWGKLNQHVRRARGVPQLVNSESAHSPP